MKRRNGYVHILTEAMTRDFCWKFNSSRKGRVIWRRKLNLFAISVVNTKIGFIRQCTSFLRFIGIQILQKMWPVSNSISLLFRVRSAFQWRGLAKTKVVRGPLLTGGSVDNMCAWVEILCWPHQIHLTFFKLTQCSTNMDIGECIVVGTQCSLLESRNKKTWHALKCKLFLLHQQRFTEIKCINLLNKAK